MRGRGIAVRLAALALWAGALAAPAAGQEAAPILRSPVVTVDQERLFTDSAYGKALLAELEAASAVLAAENREIEARLVAEERALTDERPDLEPEAFREKAAAFDEKVVAIRAEQDEKARALVRRREAAQKSFYAEVLPILTEIVRERGAVAVLESRAVILSADQIDITAQAIARIDERLAPGQTGDDAPGGAGQD